MFKKLSIRVKETVWKFFKNAQQFNSCNQYKFVSTVKEKNNHPFHKYLSREEVALLTYTFSIITSHTFFEIRVTREMHCRPRWFDKLAGTKENGQNGKSGDSLHT